jgi:hypothetical protein
MEIREITLAAALAEIARPTVVAHCATCEEATSFEARPGRGAVCSRCGSVWTPEPVLLRRSA